MKQIVVLQNEKAIIAGIVKAINKETASKKGYVLDVIDVGEKLISYKGKVAHGEWEDKVKTISKAVSDTGFGSDRASEYMKVARNKAFVLAYFDSDTSVRQLTKHISEITPEQKAEIEKLKLEEEQKRITAEAEKAVKAEAKKQPEILEGEFVEVKTPQPAPKTEPKEEVKTGFVQIDAKELENIEDNMHELASLNKSISKDNDSMERVFNANDQLSAAAKEIKRLNDLNTSLEGRLNSFMTERNALIKEAKYWRGRFEKLEKSVAAKIETQKLEPGLASGLYV